MKCSLEALRYVAGHFAIRSMSDIPCGDMNWMSLFFAENPQLDYTGYDIVSALIEQNASKYPEYAFRQMDVTREIPPKTDLIFCKELLLHLQYEDICKTLNNIKHSGTEYLLLHNNFGAANILQLPDLQPGTARGIDVCAPPFRYPEPLWHNKYCALWKLADVPELTVTDEPIRPEEQTNAERELRVALDNQIGTTKRLQAALDGLREEMDGLLASRSWKLTQPLRTLWHLFRKG